jgi:hypothetical protein
VTSVTAARTGPAPSPAQRDAIKDLLRSQPSLAAGCPLALIYTKNWSAQASWLCAFGRAAGLDVTLLPVAPDRHVIERRLGQQKDTGRSVIVLAELTLALPPGSVQLAGLPGIAPLDMYASQAELLAQAQAAAATLTDRLLVSTAGPATLEVGIAADGWHADTGLDQNKAFLVLPAGSVRADVATAEGTFVADAALAVNRPLNHDARLAAHPVTAIIEGGLVTSADCADPVLRQLLHRAIQVHRAAGVTGIRLGTNHRIPSASPEQGPVNACRAGAITITLTVDPAAAYSAASADLRIDLTANEQGGGGNAYA